jgi:hypothetical protein
MKGGIHRISSDRFIADWQSSDSQRQALVSGQNPPHSHDFAIW